MKITIEIDCEPFAPRPDIYFKHIWQQILDRADKIPEAVSKFFGCWRWDDITVSEDQQKEIGNYLTRLYNNGNIRYASW